MAWSLIGNIKGPTGATGARGSSWTTSSSNPAAPGELVGDQHLNSTTGDVFEWNGASWAAKGSIQGPTGATGAPGSPGVKWFTGTGTPTDPGSNSGDLYLDGDLGDVYEWSGTSWSPVGNLAGPVGPQGIQGVQGPKGDTGNAGADGADGDSAYAVAVSNGFIGTEAQWLASLVGEQGPKGDTGPAGPPGDPNLLADIAFTGSASDLTAGTVPDARMPARLGNGVVVPTILTTVVLDATLAGGFYQVASAASPTGVIGGLLVSGSGVGSATQLFTDSVTHRTYTRRFNNSTAEWSAWERIAFLDIANWITEDDEQVTTEDDTDLAVVVGVK